MNISYLLVYLSALSIIFDSLEAFILERVCIRAGTALSARRSRTTNSKRTQLPNLSEKGFPDDIADVYDLIVIGSGSGGEACAIESAKLGLNRVAVVEKKAMFGGRSTQAIYRAALCPRHASRIPTPSVASHWFYLTTDWVDGRPRHSSIVPRGTSLPNQQLKYEI